MDGVSHMTIGAVTASTLGKDKSFGAQMWIGAASHLIADLIPSYDPDPRKGEVLPFYAGAAFVLAFLAMNDPKGRRGLLAGAVGGWLPDIEHVTHYLKIQERKYFPTHLGDPERPALQTPIPRKWGVPLLLAVNGFALGYLAVKYGGESRERRLNKLREREERKGRRSRTRKTEASTAGRRPRVEALP